MSRVDTWRNWAGTESATGLELLRPSSVGDLAAGVAAAAARGRKVKAVGAGHSFTGCATPEQVMVRLDGLAAIGSADRATGRVTVGAGIRLADLNAGLAALGLALPNLGDVDRQTIAGAIATGTHGTGAALGGLATQVTALDLVTADGSVLHCSAEESPDVFAAARIGIGALGVVAAITLDCVPAFLLHADERPQPLAEVLAGFDEIADGNDHFEFYWFPHTAVALTKRNNRVPAGTPAAPLGRFRQWLEDDLLANRALELVNRLATRRPALVPALNGVASRALTARQYVDASYRVFCSPRTVVFRECEYAVPREHLVDVLTELRAWIDRSGERLPFPVEVRVAAADDIWLSTASGRASAYVAVHQYHRLDHRRYFAAFEKIAASYGGRPHWGKLHGADAERLAGLYPRFGDFLAVRDRLDPGRVFANAYTRRVLGD